MIKKCKKCGTEYNGSAHSWYCNNCRQQIKFEQRQADIARIKNKKIENTCVICGKKFIAYQTKKTCSSECEIKLKALRKEGHYVSNNAKKKIAEKNCLRWHLVSPEGKHYCFDNLCDWARKNCNLFGFENTEKNSKKIVSGICQAKKGKIACTYKEWKAFDGNEKV